MNITISVSGLTAAIFTLGEFDEFRNLISHRRKIDAIKYMRDRELGWGLLLAKEFVEGCNFPEIPPPASTLALVRDVPNIPSVLHTLKEDLREMIVQDYPASKDRLFDLYEKVTANIKE